MSFTFNCYGHENIRGTHKTTLEFTKDVNLGVSGDCIIGVSSDYDLGSLLKFISGKLKLKCILNVDGLKESFIFSVNPSFNDEFEIVIRMGVHLSERTLGNDCDKSAFYLNRDFVSKLKDNKTKMVVKFEEHI